MEHDISRRTLKRKRTNFKTRTRSRTRTHTRTHTKSSSKKASTAATTKRGKTAAVEKITTAVNTFVSQKAQYYFIRKHPLYVLLNKLNVPNIISDDGETFNFKPIFNINRDIILNPGIHGTTKIDLDVGDLTQFFNTIPSKGIAGRITNENPQGIKIDLNKFMPLDNSQIDTIDFSILELPISDKAPLQLAHALLHTPLTTSSIYIIYASVFNGVPRNRDNIAHISAAIIHGGQMYSFGWGTESPAPSLMRPDQINKPGYIQSPEVLTAIRKNAHTDVNIIDIGYFTHDMRDRLNGLIQNANKLLVSSKLIQYDDIEKIGKQRTAVKIVELLVNDYRANLKDYKYWKWAGRMAQQLGRFNCTTFLEYIFENKIVCAKKSLCNMGAFQFVVSDPATCHRISGTGSNYVNPEGYTDYNAIFKKLNTIKTLSEFG